MEKNTVLRWVKADPNSLPRPERYERRNILYKGAPGLVCYVDGVWCWCGNSKEESKQHPIKSSSWAAIEWLEEAESPAPLSAATEQRLCGDVSREEIEKAAHEDYPHGSTHPIGSAGRSIYENKLASFIKGVNWLLSQRQPVAPEREEADDEKAKKWFSQKPTKEMIELLERYSHLRITGESLTTAIWRKETSPSAENKGTEGLRPFGIPKEGASGSADGLSKKGGEG